MGEIRNIGLINAMELTPDRTAKAEYPAEWRVGYQVYKRALGKGLMLRPLGNVLYFNPPLIIDEATIDKAVDICAESIEEILPGL